MQSNKLLRISRRVSGGCGGCSPPFEEMLDSSGKKYSYFLFVHMYPPCPPPRGVGYRDVLNFEFSPTRKTLHVIMKLEKKKNETYSCLVFFLYPKYVVWDIVLIFT